MKIVIEIDEMDLKRLVKEHIDRTMGDVEVDSDKIQIETKSKQNYKSEWEVAAFRVRLEVVTK